MKAFFRNYNDITIMSYCKQKLMKVQRKNVHIASFLVYI